MDGQTTLTFWQMILLALGPATLAAGVAIVAPIVQEHRREAAELKRKKGEKLEELLTAIFECDRWEQARRNENLFGVAGVEVINPLPRVDMLTKVYFPQFSDLASTLGIALRDFDLWTIQLAQRRLRGEAIDIEAYRDKYDPISRAIATFTRALTSYGHHELAK